MVPACATYVTCTNHFVGFSACVMMVTSVGLWDTKAQQFEIATYSSLHWPNMLAGTQNTACVARAGGSCERAMACTNQGRAVNDCVPPAGYFGGRYCRDAVTLAACTATGSDGRTLESAVRCDDLGAECVEFERENDRLAACGHWAKEPVEGTRVTCDGSMAKVQIQNVYFTWDCALMNAECRAGVYQSWDNYEFCRGDGPACDLATMTQHCSGTSTITFCNGQEIGLDCRAFGHVCEDTRIVLDTYALCVYEEAGCNPYSFEETCEGGRITYCGPDGVATQSCTQLGYAGCEMNVVFARCSE